MLPGGTKRDRTDPSVFGATAGDSASIPVQEERRTRTRTSVIIAQAAGRAAALGESGNMVEEMCGPEAERRRFGGINSAGMHVPVSTSEPMVIALQSLAHCSG